MEVEWDGRKAEANLRKHGVAFPDALAAFEDLLAIFKEDDRGAEMRHKVIGRDSLHRILMIVYTWRGNRIRLVSARSATASERNAYYAYYRK